MTTDLYPRPMRQSLRHVAITGAICAFIIEIPLWVTGIVTWPAGYQWISSLVLGKSAFRSIGAAYLGVLLHLAVSFGWVAIYVALARRFPAVNRQPLISGALFGLVVFIIMQAVIAAGGSWQAPTALSLTVGLVDHLVFFGIPIALLTASSLPGRARVAPSFER